MSFKLLVFLFFISIPVFANEATPESTPAKPPENYIQLLGNTYRPGYFGSGKIGVAPL